MTTLGGANLRSSTYQVPNEERPSQQSSITPHGAVPEENETRINVEESSNQELDGSSDGPDPIFYDGERRDEYLTYCVPLYHAAIKGDWKTAKLIIDERPDVVRFGISRKLDTALHIAAAAKRATFVEQLVKHMNTSDLALKNKDGNTAIHYAAASGIVKTAKVMYEMNTELPLIRGCEEWTPLYVAALFGQREMMSYLYMRTDLSLIDDAKFDKRIELLNVIISAEYYDVALDILGKYPSLAFARDPYTKKTALHVLARKPSAMGTGSELGIWKRSVNSC